MGVSKTFQSDFERDVLLVFDAKRKQMDWKADSRPEDAECEQALFGLESSLAEYVAWQINPGNIDDQADYVALVGESCRRISLCISVIHEIL